MFPLCKFYPKPKKRQGIISPACPNIFNSLHKPFGHDVKRANFREVLLHYSLSFPSSFLPFGVPSRPYTSSYASKIFRAIGEALTDPNPPSGTTTATASFGLSRGAKAINTPFSFCSVRSPALMFLFSVHNRMGNRQMNLLW